MTDERKILNKTIKDAQKVIDKAKADLEKLNVTYSIGDRFIGKKREKYILVATVPAGHPKPCANIVSIASGNLYGKQDVWVDDNSAITQDELDRMKQSNPLDRMKQSNPDKLVRYWDNRKKERV